MTPIDLLLATMPKELTYVSFASDELGCLGIVILEGALDPVSAALQAHLRGINPGGEVFAVACNRDVDPIPLNEFRAMAANTNRLISPDEARVLFEAKAITEWEADDDSN